MRAGPERLTLFLGFESFKIFKHFKITFGYYLSNFCVLVSFQAMFSFYIRVYRCTEKKIGAKRLKKLYILVGWLTNSVDFTSQM